MPLRFQTIWLNLTFYLLFFAVSVLLVPVLTLIGVVMIPFGSWRRTLARARFLIKIFGRTITLLGEPLVHVRREQIHGNWPRPCIYVFNHRSASDAFIASWLPGEGVQIVNLWPFKIPVLGFFARLAGYLSIREMPQEEFVQRGGKLLEEGVSIVGFPEGTRSTSREMGSFHGAIFRLAQETGFPIVPVCLSGTENSPRKGTLVLHPGKVRIRPLEPIIAETYRDMSSFKLKNIVRDRIAEELDRMEPAE